MPKPDQNISSSAALQRPQRQKALPKPLSKDKNIETDPDILTEKVAEPVEVSADLSSQVSPSEVGLPELNLESKPESISSKPKLKPQLKPKLKPQTVTESLVPEAIIPEQNLEPQTVEILVESLVQSPVVVEPVMEIASTVEVVEIEILEGPATEKIEVIDLAVETVKTQRSPDLAVTNQKKSNKSNKSNKPKQEVVIETPDPIFWCQAVGMVAGKYIPGSEAFQKGELLTNNGFTYRAYILSKAIKSLEKRTDLSVAHQFVVYPKTSKQNGVRFEILATDVASKIDEFEDGQFNIRGLLTKQLDNAFLIEIQRRPEYLHPSQYDRFTIEVKGILPVELVNQLIYIKCQLTESYLSVINYEHLACPIVPKSIETKTEKPKLKPKAPNIEALES